MVSACCEVCTPTLPPLSRKLLFSLSKVPLYLPVLLLYPALSLCMLLFGTQLGHIDLCSGF